MKIKDELSRQRHEERRRTDDANENNDTLLIIIASRALVKYPRGCHLRDESRTKSPGSQNFAPASHSNFKTKNFNASSSTSKKQIKKLKTSALQQYEVVSVP
jgi:hypothetical protein